MPGSRTITRRAFPGYYAVKLPELGITAELTATRRVGVHRYTFAESKVPHLLIHVSSVLGKGKSKEGHVRILPEANEIEGSVRTFGTFASALRRTQDLFCRAVQPALRGSRHLVGRFLFHPDRRRPMGDDRRRGTDVREERRRRNRWS